MFNFIKNLFKFNFQNKNSLKIADDVKNQLAENMNINIPKNQINQYNYGLNYSDVKILIEEENNRANQRLIAKIEPRLLPEDKEKIKEDCDFLYTYNEAVKISAKKKDNAIDETLSELIIKRINEKNDLGKIVYNEAVKTMEKLTQNQLNILAIAFLIRFTTFYSENIEELIEDITRNIKPFIKFETKTMDFSHIEYTQCGIIEPMLKFKKINEFFKGENYKYLNEGDINKYLEKNIIGEELLKKWKPPMSILKLTSVGQAIASEYIKITTGEKISPVF